jgi:hypothetical protein
MLLKRLAFLLLPALVFALPGHADEAEDATKAELEQLFILVEQSGCVFTRNGSDHDSADAADHLRLKARRGKRYYDSPDEYIDRMATESSWTGKAYSVQCTGEESQSSNTWLHGLLDGYRGKAKATTSME